MGFVTLNEIQAARQRIRAGAWRTPLLPYPGDARLWLKAENLQPMGAFKIRGAYNAIASLSADARARGVVAHSSGNHAQAVAYAARALGVKAVIVMPQNAPSIKRTKTQEYGAEVVTVGNASSERAAKAEALAAEFGLVPVPPFDDECVIAGQGTLGLEILEDASDVDLVLVPVSGGGLISGVAAALKLSQRQRQRQPQIRVIGVEPEFAADAQASFRQGRLVGFSAEQVARTAADGLRVQQLGAITWPHVQAYVDDIVTVSEAEIRAAMRALALQAKLVAEPSGAVTTAAWLFHSQSLPSAQRVVAIISGGNVEPEALQAILAST
jgi:threonine dehydratase